MFTFLHAADIHLDSPLRRLDRYEGAPAEAFRQASRRAFDNLVELAVSETVDFIVIAGDLYDGDWKDYNTGLYFVSRMARFKEAGIAVFLVAGNHDAANRMTRSLRLPDNVTLFPADQPATVCLPGIDAAVHGQSFAAPAVKTNLAANYPAPVSGRFNIGVLHTALSGREGHEPYAPCTVDNLCAVGYDYWALGHVHRRDVVCEHPWIVFPGNLQGRHPGETGPKGCVRVDVSDSGAARVRFEPLDVIRWEPLQLNVTGAADGFEMLDRFSRSLDVLLADSDALPVALRVHLNGQSAACSQILADSHHWINEIRSAAAGAGGGRIWVEKVLFGIHPIPSAVVRKPGGAMAEIHDVMAELMEDKNRCTELAADLADLARKLPPELRDGPDALRLDDPVWIARLLAEVSPMLVRRLMGKEPR
jgi:exonuclease SbcD